MASLVISNTFIDATTILATPMNTNFDDIETYLNDRNSGSTAWDRVLATNSSAIAGVFNNGAGTVDILNALDNGTFALRVTDGGNIVPGSGALSTTATDGFVYLETCAGLPTGVPTSYTGRIATVYDSSNSRLYLYNSGWQNISNPSVDNSTIEISGGAIQVKDLGITAAKLVSAINLVGNAQNTTGACFLATVASTQTDVTGDGTLYTIPFATEQFDQASNYNNGTYTFTAPVTGKYLFTINVSEQSTATGNKCELMLVTTARTYTKEDWPASQIAQGFSVIANMTASDTAVVKLKVSGGSKVVDILAASTVTGSDVASFFSGRLIA